MKYLVIILIVLSTISCKKSWYSQGSINPENTCEFIVNDSISIVGTKAYSFIKYSVVINNSIVNPDGLFTYHGSRDSFKEVINYLQKNTFRHLAGNETSYEKYLREEKENENIKEDELLEECFKY